MNFRTTYILHKLIRKRYKSIGGGARRLRNLSTEAIHKRYAFDNVNVEEFFWAYSIQVIGWIFETDILFRWYWKLIKFFFSSIQYYSLGYTIHKFKLLFHITLQCFIFILIPYALYVKGFRNGEKEKNRAHLTSTLRTNKSNTQKKNAKICDLTSTPAIKFFSKLSFLDSIFSRWIFLWLAEFK